MADDAPKESAPVNDNVAAQSAETRSPDLDATKLLSERSDRTQQSDSKNLSDKSQLSSLGDLTNFPKTALLGGMDKSIAAEMQNFAKDKALSFDPAKRYLTKSA